MFSLQYYLVTYKKQKNFLTFTIAHFSVNMSHNLIEQVSQTQLDLNQDLKQLQEQNLSQNQESFPQIIVHKVSSQSQMQGQNYSHNSISQNQESFPQIIVHKISSQSSMQGQKYSYSSISLDKPQIGTASKQLQEYDFSQNNPTEEKETEEEKNVSNSSEKQIQIFVHAVASRSSIEGNQQEESIENTDNIGQEEGTVFISSNYSQKKQIQSIQPVIMNQENKTDFKQNNNSKQFNKEQDNCQLHEKQHLKSFNVSQSFPNSQEFSKNSKITIQNNNFLIKSQRNNLQNQVSNSKNQFKSHQKKKQTLQEQKEQKLQSSKPNHLKRQFSTKIRPHLVLSPGQVSYQIQKNPSVQMTRQILEEKKYFNPFSSAQQQLPSKSPNAKIRKIVKRSPYGMIELEIKQKKNNSKITNLRILKPKQFNKIQKLLKYNEISKENHSHGPYQVNTPSQVIKGLPKLHKNHSSILPKINNFK